MNLQETKQKMTETYNRFGINIFSINPEMQNNINNLVKRFVKLQESVRTKRFKVKKLRVQNNILKREFKKGA